MKTICNFGLGCLTGVLLLFPSFSYAQDCASKVSIQLNNIRGGVFANQTVSMKCSSDERVFKTKSTVDGLAEFMLPCNEKYEVTISNYVGVNQISSPASERGYASRTFTYEPNMAEKNKSFAMSDEEKKQVDAAVALLPTITKINAGVMTKPANMNHYSTYSLTLINLTNDPLQNEQVTFVGEKNGKSFEGSTNMKGVLVVYLPKGDTYSIDFKLNKDYAKQDVKYTKGTATGRLSLMYLGTAEIERRMKIEAERIAAEEKRLKAEQAAFVKWCKELKLTEEEGHRRKLKASLDGFSDLVVAPVLNRNKWSEKLIICDLTGSMDPYANQLSAWYQLNYKHEPNLQFVFFNDGDGMADGSKVVGNTGGIYYQKASSMDSLIAIMSKVRSKGSGGDCPENNMEALIKGVKMAKPYKELVMIVDNNAPVKDIALLKTFNKPVHIILCGAQEGEVLLDYLLIAWKTKGSIHTIEEDIYKIAGMLEGESIKVGGVTYKIMGGRFVQVSKM